MTLCAHAKGAQCVCQPDAFMFCPHDPQQPELRKLAAGCGAIEHAQPADPDQVRIEFTAAQLNSFVSRIQAQSGGVAEVARVVPMQQFMADFQATLRGERAAPAYAGQAVYASEQARESAAANDGGARGAQAKTATLRYDVLYHVAQAFNLDYNAVCRCAREVQAGPV